MPVSYTNRAGDVYYLHVRQTKTGKTSYHFSRKSTGALAESIPDGYEIHEQPSNAQVFLRKVRPRAIRDEEVALVRRLLRAWSEVRHPVVDVEGKSVIIYTSGHRRADLERLADKLSPFGRAGLGGVLDELEQRGNYSPMLRFTLVDEKDRRFRAERWCFLGSIDRWMPLMGPDGTLADLTARYAPHLGQESFFELM